MFSISPKPYNVRYLNTILPVRDSSIGRVLGLLPRGHQFESSLTRITVLEGGIVYLVLLIKII